MIKTYGKNSLRNSNTLQLFVEFKQTNKGNVILTPSLFNLIYSVTYYQITKQPCTNKTIKVKVKAYQMSE